MQLNIILIKIYNSFVKLGVSLKKIESDYGGSELPKLVSVRLLMFVDLGGPNPVSSEICTFFCTYHNISPFVLCK